MAYYPKECDGCPFRKESRGFVGRDTISARTKLVVCGDCGGDEEAKAGQGWMGGAGRLLRGRLQRLGLNAWPGALQDFASDYACLCAPPYGSLTAMGASPAVIADACAKRHPRTSGRVVPTVLYGGGAIQGRTGFALKPLTVRGSLLPLREGGWGVAALDPKYVKHGRDGKSMVELLPLLALDAHRAMTQPRPLIPKVFVDAYDKFKYSFDRTGPEYVSIDIEGSGGVPNIFVMTWGADHAFVFHWCQEAKALLEYVLKRSEPIYHNASYDVTELQLAGVEPPKRWVDTINTAALIDPGLRKGLQAQVLTWVPGTITWKGLINHEGGPDFVNNEVALYRELWTEVLTRLKRPVPQTGDDWYCFYNGLDGAWTYGLFEAHRKDLQGQRTQSGFFKNRYEYYTKVIQPLQNPWVERGLRGLPVNPARRDFHVRALSRLERMAKRILDNVASETLQSRVETVQAEIDILVAQQDSEREAGSRKFSKVKELTSLRNKLKTANNAMVEGFNLDSNPQRKALVYGYYGLPEITRERKQRGGGKTRTVTTDDDAMEELLLRVTRKDADGNPAPTAKPKRGTLEEVARVLKALVAGKKWATWRRNFCEATLVGGLIRTVDGHEYTWADVEENGYPTVEWEWVRWPRMQTQYNLHRATSGRFSSGTDDSDSEKKHEVQQLQNVPEKLRDMVEADPGYVMVGGDWSNVEWAFFMYQASMTPAIVHEMNGVPDGFHLGMLDKQQLGDFDAHRYLASHAFNVPEEHVTKSQRKLCKPYTHGRNYLGGPRTLGRSAGHTVAVAEMVCKAHDRAFKVGFYQRWLMTQVKKRHFIETLLGWRRYFHDIDPKPNEPLGTQTQGNAADLMKWVLVRMEEAKPPAYEILTTTHDSALMQVPIAQGEEGRTWLKGQMEQPIPWTENRTWRADVHVGKTWRDV